MARQFSAQQLAALPPTTPSDWVVEGLLRTNRKRPSLLCGFPGSGKSTIANQLAIAVAQGRPFLGRETVQGRVLYWKNEDSLEDVGEDLLLAGLAPHDQFDLLLPKPNDNNFVELSDALARQPDTKLCIVETLADFLQIADSNSNDDCRNALQRFSDLVVVPNPQCAFLMLHHFNKSNMTAELSGMKIQGGTAIAGGTDAKFYLQQVSDSDPRRIFHAEVRKGRGMEQTYLVFDEATQTATLGETVKSERIAARQAEKERKEVDRAVRIKQVVAEHPGLPKGQIVRMVGGKAQVVSSLIDDLIGLNCLEVVQGGDKGNAQLLYVAGSSEAVLARQQIAAVESAAA